MSKAERRSVSFQSLDDILADVERLAAGKVRTTGQHSFSQIVRHLALANDMVTGKIVAPKPPLILRILLPFIRSSILKGPVKPGIKLPAKAETLFWPKDEMSVAEAVESLRVSIENYKKKGPLPVHPIFGKATREQIDNLTLSHAAMHLSFVHPA